MKNIKILLLCAVLFLITEECICQHRSSTCQPTVIEDPDFQQYIARSVESFRKQMKRGKAKSNIPVLDPMRIENFDALNLNIPGNLATIKFTVIEMDVTGLSRFRMHELQPDFETLCVKVKLSVPLVISKGIYDLDIMIWNVFPLKGRGEFTTTLKEGVISGVGQLTFNASADVFQIKDLDLDLKFDDFRVSFRNFMGLGLIADHFQNMFPGVIRNVFEGTKSLFMHPITCIFKDEVNRYLKKPAVREIIRRITSGE